MVMNKQPDMRQIMQQAQQMQEQLAKAQAELAERNFEGSAGGGMVTAVVTGGPELVEVKISPEVVDPDDIEPEAFTDIDSLWAGFFADAAS